MLGFAILILLNLAIGYVLALCQYRPDLLPLDWLKSRTAAAGIGVLDSPHGVDIASNPSAINPHLDQTTYDAIESADAARQIESTLAELPAEPEITEDPPEPPIADIDPRHGESLAVARPSTALDTDADKSAARNPPPAEELSDVAFIEDPSLEDNFRAQQAAARDTLIAFQSDLQAYQSQISALDDQVRSHTSDDDPLVVQNFIQRFDQLSDHYLHQQRSHLSSVGEQAKLIDADGHPFKPCRTAALEHAAAIDTARDNLAAAAMLADAAASCKAFLLATHRITDSSHALDAQLTQTIENFASESPSTDRAQRRDPPAQPNSQAGTTNTPSNLEEFVAHFLATNPPASGTFCAALIEIDQASKIHSAHGRTVCDRILTAIDQVLAQSISNLVTSVDNLGQQVLCLLPNAAVREFTGQIEHARLRIDATEFARGDKVIKASLSCGITRSDCNVQPESLLARLRELLRQAQRYGRNRSFVQDGAQSAPASPHRSKSSRAG